MLGRRRLLLQRPDGFSNLTRRTDNTDNSKTPGVDKQVVWSLPCLPHSVKRSETSGAAPLRPSELDDMFWNVTQKWWMACIGVGLLCWMWNQGIDGAVLQDRVWCLFLQVAFAFNCTLFTWCYTVPHCLQHLQQWKHTRLQLDSIVWIWYCENNSAIICCGLL